MKIEITDHRKIYTVQKEFMELFPFLKIEFFEKPHTSVGASGRKSISHSAKTIGSCRTNHRKGFVTITPNMTVRELQQTFSDVYGLTIQISAKAPGGWLDASVKDGWSLEKHNKAGQQAGLVSQTT